MLKKIFGVVCLCVVSAGGAFAQLSWGEPVVLGAAPEGTHYTDPVFAGNIDGNVAAAWLSHSGTTSNTAWDLRLPMKRNADAFAAFSNDRGQTWSQPVQISEPDLLNTEIDVEAGGDR